MICTLRHAKGTYHVAQSVKELNGNFICGRCHETEPNAVSQLCYERMMSNFTFPCRYDKEGCTDRLRFNSSLEHERKCQYRPIVCPSVLKKACTQSIPACQLYTHFIEAHKDLISNDGQFKIHLDEKTRYNALMLHDDNTVVVKYLYDDVERRLHLEVAYVSSDEDSLYYQLQLINGTNYDNSLSLSQQACTLYETQGITSTNCAVIDLEMYLAVLENPPSLILKISLTSLVEYSTRSGSEMQTLQLKALRSVCNFIG
ncbi:uncharacterized protein LOC116182697 [Photinus pyralis]|uniref:uncharacterized protein LOC116182697 n=1 Tax=Photinus pyralis TaxID=7054 RepID=UPI0012674E7F|nr:uncharacterized protein LOC116182697 [Photinus pyralis]